MIMTKFLGFIENISKQKKKLKTPKQVYSQFLILLLINKQNNKFELFNKCRIYDIFNLLLLKLSVKKKRWILKKQTWIWAKKYQSIRNKIYKRPSNLSSRSSWEPTMLILSDVLEIRW